MLIMLDEVVGRVYAIRRADDFVVRYVGQTSQPLERRLTKHFSVARSERTTPFYSWLRKHADEDIAIDELEAVSTTREALGEAERFWIGLLQANGQPLLNLSLGGLGPSGVVWTAEQRAAASVRSTGRPGVRRFGAANPFFGKTHSSEQRAAWSAARRGQGAGELNPNLGKFGADHPSFGAVRSPETKLRLSEQKRGSLNPNFGKQASSETRAKRSAAQRGVPKPSSARSAHTRYHTNRMIWKAGCRHCAATPPPAGFTIVQLDD
jgi:hypothetical protein